MKSDFEPTPTEQILHIVHQMMGFVAIISSIPPMVYLLSKDAKAKITQFRWLLLSIVVSGMLSDIQLCLILAPFPLLPHIAFWSDSVVMRIHRRAIVYLTALTIFILFAWVTTMLLAFLFRLTAVVRLDCYAQLNDLHQIDNSYLNRVKYFAYFSIALCAFNSCMSCGVMIVTYPSQPRIDAYIVEKVPEMEFILDSPGFIYFTKMDKFYYAIIGMTHILVAVLFYCIVFLAIFFIINMALLRVRHVMSASTRKMHYMMIKSLTSQMILPLFSMIIPIGINAISLRFGSDKDNIDHQLIGHFCIIFPSLHSILNTLSMFMFVSPFRKYVTERVSKTNSIHSQSRSTNNRVSTVASSMRSTI